MEKTNNSIAVKHACTLIRSWDKSILIDLKNEKKMENQSNENIVHKKYHKP